MGKPSAKGPSEPHLPVAPRERRRRKFIPADAVIIKGTGGTMTKTSFADTLRKMRRNIDPVKLGANVEAVRRTKRGDLLLELEKGSSGAVALQEALVSSLGATATVRTLLPQTTIEVRDFDEATDEGELRDALKGSTSCMDCSVAIRPAFRGTQLAIVRLPAQDAKKLLQSGKLRVGWINCRVRERHEVVRRYRCLGFGHHSAQCKDLVDRSSACRRCGQDGHHSKGCTNAPNCIVFASTSGPAAAGHVLGSRQCAGFVRELERARK